MLRVLSHWTELFSLRCDTRDELFPFYSKVMRTTHLLLTKNLVAVTDDSFLKAFLAKSISCEELQTEAKDLLTDGSASWSVILDRINADCRAQVSGESMRTDGTSTSRAQLRRARGASSSGDGAIPRKAPKPAVLKLPANTGNLIPHKYYLQFKGWFEAMRVPEQDRTEEQKKYLDSFVWHHTQDPKNKKPWVPKPGHRPNNHRPKGDGYRSRRARGRDRGRDRSPSYSSEDSRDHGRSRSRRGRSSRDYSRSRSRSASRSPSRSRDRNKSEGDKARSRRSVIFSKDK